MAIIEARPYRPFKSSEEYLEAMKEDLAEWMNTLYPGLGINADNFMDRLDTGVALCKHANYVRQAAEDYLARRQARNKSMTRSMTSGLAGPILAMGNVHYLPAAKSGTFFARDNVSNFITWCRKSLKIIECLLFETDDLIMRKNEKHVILCLLEVARRGAKFGMLAPMLVQMERQIDREIAADNKANGGNAGTQTTTFVATECSTQTDAIGVTDANEGDSNELYDTDSDNEDTSDEGPMLMYGPQPQIITNDLKSLDEMVRDLVEKCTCPSQFPMVRVSEGKYRIGDTKVLIFVRILRSHVMVRVGGGWDTLAHYLDKHDPCRCRAQHRTSVAARLIPRSTNPTGNGIELHKAQVIFERSPPTARRIISNFNSPASPNGTTTIAGNTSSPNTTNNSLSPSLASAAGPAKYRSRSPTPQRKFRNYINGFGLAIESTTERPQEIPPSTNLNSSSNSNRSQLLVTPSFPRRSMSPSPRRLIDMRKKQNSLESYNNTPTPLVSDFPAQLDEGAAGSTPSASVAVSASTTNGTTTSTTGGNGGEQTNKFENISDNGSEISDEGYRSLGVIQSNAQKRESLHSQASMEDAESNARLDQTSSDSQISPTDDAATKVVEIVDAEFTTNDPSDGPLSLPTMLPLPKELEEEVEEELQVEVEEGNCDNSSKFEQSGVFITDDEITVDIAGSTGLRRTGLRRGVLYPRILNIRAVVEDVIDGGKPEAATAAAQSGSKIPRSPLPPRRRSSIDNSTCGGAGGSLQDLTSRTGLPSSSLNRKKPVYRSVRKPPSAERSGRATPTPTPPPRTKASYLPTVRDVTNTWSGRSAVAATASKKRPTINADTFASPSPFERNVKTRSSQILYDSNGRRVRGCTSSLTTSPVKNHASSPLIQQLREAANSTKNEAEILEKMKTLLSRYAASNQAKGAKSQNGSNSGSGKKTPVYEDFTTAWVHCNGNLERSNSCSPPAKTRSKRSSAASSCESNNSRDMTVVVSPRRERGASKIPAPVRHHTELY
ncbi:GAS2-like protein pickled eggs [Scaptodrosophila lebanonensis]|uniref:GAS2-like protein pickled eggs n=1 Tax=Drosophila lebanonensis TaxID=7225 RepID=A0A6J2UH40_DROLE|nr:GAS2-like protein pickled eggs [Scaptodrosophila lebanonensis]XP_030386457.1 GAS2-like protein pickled eggs [Scaptodrosophila lebanonensis]